MSVSAISSQPVLTPVSAPRENEAAEKVLDNEALEAARPNNLKDGMGTKIDVSA